MRRVGATLAMLLAASCGGGDGENGNGGGAECDPGRACPQICVEDLDCPVGQVCGSGVCENPAPTSNDYERCYLDADCPLGDHCSLGVCAHDCARDLDCPGDRVCTDRGRCVESEQVEEPPPVETPQGATLILAQTTVDFGLTRDAREVQIQNDGNAALRLRVLSDTRWLAARPAALTIPAGGVADLEVLVDRNRLDGTTGRLTVVSTAGVQTITVEALRTVSGRYQGQIRIDAPVPLGARSLQLELMEGEDGTLTGVIEGEHTPALPMNAPLAGSVGEDPGDGAVPVELELAVVGLPGSVLNPDYGHPIRQRWQLSGALVGAGRLEGDLVIEVDGIRPDEPIQLAGSFLLDRFDEPDGRTPTTIPDYEPAGADEPDWPDCSQCPSDGCGPAARFDAAFGFYEAFYLAGGYEHATHCAEAGGTDCLDYAHAFCALKESYEAWVSDAELLQAQSDLLDVVKGLTAYWSMIATDIVITRVFEVATDTPLSTQATHLNTAQRRAALAVHADPAVTAMPGPLDPFMVRLLYELDLVTQERESRFREPTGTHTVNPGADLVRMIRALEIRLGIILERAELLHRLGQAESGVNQVRRALASAFLDVVVLGDLLGHHGLSPESLRGVLELTYKLQEREQMLRAGVNAAGVDEAYVPIHQRGGTLDRTNYEVIAEIARDRWQAMNTKEQALEQATRAFEATAQAQRAEAEQLIETYDGQIRDLCGEAFEIDGPELTRCDGGRLEIVRGEIEVAELLVEKAVNDQKMLWDRIEIENRRLAALLDIEAGLIEMTLQNGERRRVLDRQEQDLDRQRRSLGFVSSVGGIMGSLANKDAGSALSGVVGLFIQAAENEIENRRNAIQDERSQIQIMEQVQILEAQQDRLAAESAARVEAMLLELPNLAIQESMAVIRLAQAMKELAAVLSRAEFLAERRAARQRLMAFEALDPSDRIDHSVALAEYRDAAREARRWAFFTVRAFEYELNMTYAARGDALQAVNAATLEGLLDDLRRIFDDPDDGWRRPSRNVELISFRRHLLGIDGPTPDPETGREVSARERFRHYVLAPENWDGSGRLRLTFSTAPNTSRPIFSSNVYNDRILSMKVNLIGDDLGDRTAFVLLYQDGLSLVRDRTGEFRVYRLGERRSRLQAGVNADILRDQVIPENTEFFGRSVHAESWTLVIDLVAEPQNRDIDVTSLDDIEIVFEHGAVTLQ